MINDVFANELKIVEDTKKIKARQDISPNELADAYGFLSDKYEQLVKTLVKLTRVGDVNYKKLMAANDLIQEQKSELETLNIQLREANAAKDKFYSIIAHDLKNPLQFLLFSAGLLDDEDSPMDNAAIRDYIGRVFKTAQNLSALLENLLQWSRSQNGSMTCLPQIIDLCNLAQQSIDYSMENAREKNIRLRNDITPKTMIYADENMIQTVLRNLVGNAVKFTRADGQVILSACDKDNFIATTVTDTGIGMPPEKIETLFLLGANTSTAGTAREKGSGLGLILCHEFITKNNGLLNVKSIPGTGTTVEFLLPKKNV